MSLFLVVLLVYTAGNATINLNGAARKRKPYLGYLKELAPPLALRIGKAEEEFNRLNIIPIPSFTPKELRPEAAKVAPANELKTAQAAPPASTPPPLNASIASTTPAPIQRISAVGSSSIIPGTQLANPEEVSLILEKEAASSQNNGKDKTKIILPFNVPFQNNAAPLPPPSSALYERQ